MATPYVGCHTQGVLRWLLGEGNVWGSGIVGLQRVDCVIGSVSTVLTCSLCI